MMRPKPSFAAQPLLLLAFAFSAAIALAGPGEQVGPPQFAPGERWTYQERDGYNHNPRSTWTLETDPAQAQAPKLPGIELAFPLYPGKSWEQQRLLHDEATGGERRIRTLARARGWEKVNTPAGEFLALKIVSDSYLGDATVFHTETVRTQIAWYAPEIKSPVRLETREEYWQHYSGRAGRVLGDRSLVELISHESSPSR
jgi:hypothetical protein